MENNHTLSMGEVMRRLELLWQQDWFRNLLLGLLSCAFVVAIAWLVWKAYRSEYFVKIFAGLKKLVMFLIALLGKVIGSLVELFQGIRLIFNQRALFSSNPWFFVVSSNDKSAHQFFDKLRENGFSQSGLRFFLKGLTATRYACTQNGLLLTAKLKDSGVEDYKLSGFTDLKHSLDEIIQLRSERPIDALMLCISVKDIYPVNENLISKLRERLYREISLVQQRVEFMLPVYVVLTDAEDIPGFNAFCGAQNINFSEQMFGWSNPHPLSHGYNSDWVDEAFSSMDKSLRQLQFSTGDGLKTTEDTDDLFLFPRRFRVLGSPLRSLFDGLFKGPIDQWYWLRGIYVGGLFNDKERGQNKLAFVPALLRDKMAAEANLAEPAGRRILSRNNLLRRLQWGLIAFFAFALLQLELSNISLDNQVQTLGSVFDNIKSWNVTGLDECADMERSDEIYTLLEQLAQLKVSMDYWAIPASWSVISDLPDRTSEWVADSAFEKIIIPNLRCIIEQRAQDLAAMEPRINEPVSTVEKAQRQLHDYLNAVGEFETNLDRISFLAPKHDYQGASPWWQFWGSGADQASNVGISTHGSSMEAFISLLQYAYGVEPPSILHNLTGQHQRALSQVAYGLVWKRLVPDTPVDPDCKVPPETPSSFTRPITRSRIARHICRLNKNIVVAMMDEARLKIRKTADLRASDMGVADGDLRATNQWLTYVRNYWLDRHAGNSACVTFAAEIEARRSFFERFNYSDQVLDATLIPLDYEHCYRPVIDVLLEQNLPPHATLFTGGYDVPLHFSQDFVADAAGYSDISKLNYFHEAGADQAECYVGTRYWQLEYLQQILAYYHDYQRTISDTNDAVLLTAGDKALPAHERLARHQLQRLFNALFNKAQLKNVNQSGLSGTQLLRPLARSESILDAQSSNLAEVSESLLQVLDAANHLEFSQFEKQLTQCVRRYAGEVLVQLDQLSSASRIYQEGEFNNPVQGVSFSNAWFHVAADAEIISYLQQQIDRVTVLSGYAEAPLLVLLNVPASADGDSRIRLLSDYWQKTIIELNRYLQNQDPAGQVQVLHNYFLQQLAKTGIGDCKAILETVQPAYSNDLFSLQRLALEKRVHEDCHDHLIEDIQSRYQQVALDFNNNLAGKFPFSKNSKATSAEADPGAVREFIRRYLDIHSGLLAEIALMAKVDLSWQNAYEFLTDLNGVAEFFAYTLAANPQAASWQVQPNFKPEPDLSVGSTAIIARQLSVGRQLLDYPGTQAVMLWSPGQTLGFDLRWALDAEVEPRVVEGDSRYSVDQLNVKFEEKSTWSLLKFIQNNQSAEAGSTQTLLEFPVHVTWRDATAQGQYETAKSFLQLQLSAVNPENKQAVILQLPSRWPAYAPDLPGMESNDVK